MICTLVDVPPLVMSKDLQYMNAGAVKRVKAGVFKWFRLGLLLDMIAAFLFLSPAAEAIGESWEEVFIQANQAYKEGRFLESAGAYEKLIRAGHEDGHLYYNLGNARFRTGQIGKAIVNYERARIQMPRNADLNFNLRHARDQIRDQVTETQGVLTAAFFWLDSLSLHELFLGFALLNLLFWSILFVRLFARPEWTYYTLIVLLAFWIIGGASFSLKLYRTGTDNRAVVLVPEAQVLAGPDSRDTVLFKVHEGTIVHRERVEGEWALVSLPENKRGWMRAKAVEMILAQQKADNAREPEGKDS